MPHYGYESMLLVQRLHDAIRQHEERSKDLWKRAEIAHASLDASGIVLSEFTDLKRTCQSEPQNEVKLRECSKALLEVLQKLLQGEQRDTNTAGIMTDLLCLADYYYDDHGSLRRAVFLYGFLNDNKELLEDPLKPIKKDCERLVTVLQERLQYQVALRARLLAIIEHADDFARPYDSEVKRKINALQIPLNARIKHLDDSEKEFRHLWQDLSTNVATIWQGIAALFEPDKLVQDAHKVPAENGKADLRQSYLNDITRLENEMREKVHDMQADCKNKLEESAQQDVYRRQVMSDVANYLGAFLGYATSQRNKALARVASDLGGKFRHPDAQHQVELTANIWNHLVRYSSCKHFCADISDSLMQMSDAERQATLNEILAATHVRRRHEGRMLWHKNFLLSSAFLIAVLACFYHFATYLRPVPWLSRLIPLAPYALHANWALLATWFLAALSVLVQNIMASRTARFFAEFCQDKKQQFPGLPSAKSYALGESILPEKPSYKDSDRRLFTIEDSDDDSPRVENTV